MKKLLLLPVLLFFAACSTDETETQNVPAQEARLGGPVMPECFARIDGSVYIDLTNGMDNPVAVFTANISAGSKKYYRGVIEIELLNDCEDIESGSSVTGTYTMPGYISTAQPGTLTAMIDGDMLPGSCYRWRIVAEGASSPTGSTTCKSYSAWYEEPLF